MPKSSDNQPLSPTNDVEFPSVYAVVAYQSLPLTPPAQSRQNPEIAPEFALYLTVHPPCVIFPRLQACIKVLQQKQPLATTRRSPGPRLFIEAIIRHDHPLASIIALLNIEQQVSRAEVPIHCF